MFFRPSLGKNAKIPPTTSGAPVSSVNACRCQRVAECMKKANTNRFGHNCENSQFLRTGLVGFPAVWPILWRKSGSVEDELEVISKEQGKSSQEPGWQGYPICARKKDRG